MRIIISPAKQMNPDAGFPEALREFDRGYRFDEARSTDKDYIFIKQ